MHYFYLLFLMISLQSAYSQKLVWDSTCKDSTGMWADLNIIAEKLGTLSDTLANNLVCLEVDYYGFDKDEKLDSTVLRKGVLIVHESIRLDLDYVFGELIRLKFPIHGVKPVNLYGLNRDSSGWNDAASMSDNNTSAFNYRRITLSDELSPHAHGTAIDLNPKHNPYEKYNHDGKFIEPENGVYDVLKAGTIADGNVVAVFDQLGWVWGGRWNNPVDYQHFDLRKNRHVKHFLMKESTVKMFFSFSETGEQLSIYNSKIDRKMDKAALLISKDEFKAFEACLDSFGNDCLEKWRNYKLIYDSNFTSSFSNITSLKNIEICIDEQSAFKYWNRYCADLLCKKLRSKKVNAFIGADTHIKPDLRIAIDIGSANFSDQHESQIIYVPGAFTEENMKDVQGRLSFLNLLISDDLLQSVQLAEKIQFSIESHLNIKPLSKYLPGPNILQNECIKTNADAIYCRNMSIFSKNYCPQLLISLLSHKKSEEILKDKKSAAKFCKSLADSICEALE